MIRPMGIPTSASSCEYMMSCSTQECAKCSHWVTVAELFLVGGTLFFEENSSKKTFVVTKNRMHLWCYTYTWLLVSICTVALYNT